MSGHELVVAALFVAGLILAGLMTITVCLALLVSVFAKGYDKRSEDEIYARGKVVALGKFDDVPELALRDACAGSAGKEKPASSL